MKCPKCGYLGFETSERCRNCGYDFSLATDPAPAAELSLRSSEGAGAPLADLDLTVTSGAQADDGPRLDLDRIIGAESDDLPRADVADTPPASTRTRRGTPDGRTARHTPHRNTPTSALPLFTESDDDTPLITKPRPPRPPLSVRRTTPEIPRSRTQTLPPRPEENELSFPTEASDEPRMGSADEPRIRRAVVPPAEEVDDLEPAPSVRRITAAGIDLVLLASINIAVLYLTLALAGLSMDQVRVLPIVPLAAFFALLDGGYLIAFIAASGQTIGKMLTGIRVMRHDGSRVEISAAVVRAIGCGIALITAGLAYLPAFIMIDRRALQDRLSGTRVVRAR